MLRKLVYKDAEANTIDKIVIDGIKNDFPIMKSDISVLVDGSLEVETDDSRAFIMLQKFGFKPVA